MAEMIKISKTDSIVTAWPEVASGPGWANTLIWVLIKDRRDGVLRMESIQGDEMSYDERLLFPVATGCTASFVAAVKRGFDKK